MTPMSFPSCCNSAKVSSAVSSASSSRVPEHHVRTSDPVLFPRRRASDSRASTDPHGPPVPARGPAADRHQPLPAGPAGAAPRGIPQGRPGGPGPAPRASLAGRSGATGEPGPDRPGPGRRRQAGNCPGQTDRPAHCQQQTVSRHHGPGLGRASCPGCQPDLGVGAVGIDEACSGVRSLQTAMMLSLFLGEMYRFGVLRRLALIGASLLFVLLANLSRTTFLVCAAFCR